MKLIQYRDIGMHTYTYFYTNDDKVVSPYFDSEKEAIDWYNEQLHKFENWKPSKDIV